MESVSQLLEVQDIDEETRQYLIGALAEADGKEWGEIAEAFLSPETVEALLAIAPTAPLQDTQSVSALAAPVRLLAAPAPEASASSSARAGDSVGKSSIRKSKREQPQKEGSARPPGDHRAQDEPVATVRQSRQAEATGQSPSINIRDLSVSFGGRTLLSDAHLRLEVGHRYGFVGANGAGKSTLLRLMAAGRIPGYPDLETLLVEQEDVGDERDPVVTVMSAHKSLGRLRREEAVLAAGLAEGRPAVACARLLLGRAEARASALELDSRRLVGARGKEARARLLEAERAAASLRRDLEAAERVGRDDEAAEAACASLLEKTTAALAELDEEKLRSKAVRVLRGLGLQREQLAAPTSALSGGWRMRVALAKALFLEPRVLILDEPTNHLDWSSMLWLEEHLATLDGIILVVVSHDRQFLDGFCTDILRLAKGRLEVFKGDYSDYEATASQIHRREEKEEERRSSVGSVRRKQNSAKLEFDREVHLSFEAGPQLRYSGPLMQCRQVKVGYPGRQLTEAFDLPLDLTSRVAILGHNGCGKTSLVRTFARELPPLAGDVYVHPSLRVGYFSQHQAQALPPEQTPLELLTAFGEGVRSLDAEKHLASFGLDGPRARQRIGTLSGGEKTRVAFAHITIKQPHILLLDEPSNHLDLLTVVALAEALRAFPGGLLLVSHDRRLIKEVCPEAHQQYLLVAGVLKRADGLSRFVRGIKAAVKADAHG